MTATSTLGTFLRFVHVGACPPVGQAAAEALGRAWKTGAGPGDAAVTLDLDSTISVVWGKAKHSAAFGYTAQLGYDPLVPVRTETGETVGVPPAGRDITGGCGAFLWRDIGVPEREPDPRPGK